jgi:hypothetical protein
LRGDGDVVEGGALAAIAAASIAAVPWDEAEQEDDGHRRLRLMGSRLLAALRFTVGPLRADELAEVGGYRAGSRWMAGAIRLLVQEGDVRVDDAAFPGEEAYALAEC